MTEIDSFRSEFSAVVQEVAQFRAEIVHKRAAAKHLTKLAAAAAAFVITFRRSGGSRSALRRLKNEASAASRAANRARTSVGLAPIGEATKSERRKHHEHVAKVASVREESASSSSSSESSDDDDDLGCDKKSCKGGDDCDDDSCACICHSEDEDTGSSESEEEEEKTMSKQSTYFETLPGGATRATSASPERREKAREARADLRTRGLSADDIRGLQHAFGGVDEAEIAKLLKQAKR